MIVAFNDEFPIIATALNDDSGKRYPIVHAIFKFKDNEDKRKYYLEFSELTPLNWNGDIEEYRSAIMKLLVEDSNMNLPYLINGEWYRFTKGNIKAFGREYALLPEL